MTSRIKNILGRAKLAGRGKIKKGASKSASDKMLEELRGCQAELMQARSALRACWELCREGDQGGKITKIVIAALGKGAGKTGSE